MVDGDTPLMACISLLKDVFPIYIYTRSNTREARRRFEGRGVLLCVKEYFASTPQPHPSLLSTFVFPRFCVCVLLVSLATPLTQKNRSTSHALAFHNALSKKISFTYLILPSFLLFFFSSCTHKRMASPSSQLHCLCAGGGPDAAAIERLLAAGAKLCYVAGGASTLHLLLQHAGMEALQAALRTPEKLDFSVWNEQGATPLHVLLEARAPPLDVLPLLEQLVGRLRLHREDVLDLGAAAGDGLTVLGCAAKRGLLAATWSALKLTPQVEEQVVGRGALIPVNHVVALSDWTSLPAEDRMRRFRFDAGIVAPPDPTRQLLDVSSTPPTGPEVLQQLIHDGADIMATREQEPISCCALWRCLQSWPVESVAMCMRSPHVLNFDRVLDAVTCRASSADVDPVLRLVQERLARRPTDILHWDRLFRPAARMGMLSPVCSFLYNNTLPNALPDPPLDLEIAWMYDVTDMRGKPYYHRFNAPVDALCRGSRNTAALLRATDARLPPQKVDLDRYGVYDRPDVCFIDPISKDTALHRVLQRGSLSSIASILNADQCLDFGKRDACGRTALHGICRPSGQSQTELEEVLQLLSRRWRENPDDRIDLATQDVEGRTVLGCAAAAGHLAVVWLALKDTPPFRAWPKPIPVTHRVKPADVAALSIKDRRALRFDESVTVRNSETNKFLELVRCSLPCAVAPSTPTAEEVQKRVAGEADVMAKISGSLTPALWHCLQSWPIDSVAACLQTSHRLRLDDVVDAAFCRERTEDAEAVLRLVAQRMRSHPADTITWRDVYAPAARAGLLAVFCAVLEASVEEALPAALVELSTAYDWDLEELKGKPYFRYFDVPPEGVRHENRNAAALKRVADSRVEAI
eukprot:gene12131-8352_t